MTDPEEWVRGPRVPPAGRRVRPSDTSTDPGRSEPYESLYRIAGSDPAESYRVTRRDHEPSLSPPEGQSESADPFGWLYRTEDPVPRRAANEAGRDEDATHPVDSRSPAGRVSPLPGSTVPAVPPTDAWTAIRVGHLDPAPREARGGRGVTVLLVVLLVLAVFAAGFGIVLAVRSNQNARRQSAVVPTVVTPSVATTNQQPPQAGPSPSASASQPSVTAKPPAKASGPYAGAVTQVVPSAATAACRTAPATDGGGHPVRYDPELMVDGDKTTAWRCPGRGKGEQVAVALPNQTKVAEVGLVNGYTKLDPRTKQDRYAEYRRITRVTWTFPNGKTFRQRLTDGNEGVQTIRIPVQVTDRVTLTIESTTKPGIKAATRDAVLISEVALASPSA